MIPLNNKTKQDFLTPEQMKELEDLGVDTSDAKYSIISNDKQGLLLITYGTCSSNPDWSRYIIESSKYTYVCPTYSLAELLYKLPEWIGKDGFDGLNFMKDAPFYAFYYKTNDDKYTDEFATPEYPIVAAFETLKWCIEKGYGYSRNISDK